MQLMDLKFHCHNKIANRLHALKSTLLEPESNAQGTTSTSSGPGKIFDGSQEICEEDSLRIQALRSAVLKRKEFLRKKRQMMRSEEDYSPTSFTPFDDDEFESQFNEIVLDNEPIMSSTVAMPENDQTENDDENELRTLLIQSISKKRDESEFPSPTPDDTDASKQLLKKALIRLQQRKETVMPEKNDLPEAKDLQEVEGSAKKVDVEEKAQKEQVCPENSNTEQLTTQPSSSDSSRLVTSFKTKPVERMVINLESDSADEMHSPKSSKPDLFEKNLDSFLKTIRFRHEASSKKVEKSRVSSAQPQNTAKVVSLSNLSKASQKEYQDLIRKIKILEEAKQSRLKARELKRTKTVPEEPKIVAAAASLVEKAPGKPQDAKANAIKESLEKITLLDRDSQLR